MGNTHLVQPMRRARDVLPRADPQPVRDLADLVLSFRDCFFVRIHLQAENATAPGTAPDAGADAAFGDEVPIHLRRAPRGFGKRGVRGEHVVVKNLTAARAAPVCVYGGGGLGLGLGLRA